MIQHPLDTSQLTQSENSSVRRRTSLERRLPLMISGLLAVTIAAFGLFAFTEVRQASLSAANGQLRTIIAQTSDVAATALRTRGAALATFARNPTVQRAVSSSATGSEREAGVQLMRAKRVTGDTVSFVAQLLVDSKGNRMLIDGTAPDDRDLQMLPQTLRGATRANGMTLGVPYAKDSTMWYWSATPLSSGDEPFGYITELRRIRASSNVEQQLKGFTGQDITMYYIADGGDVWTGLSGVPITPKFDASAVKDSFRLVTNAGERVIGVKKAIENTPWSIVFTINEAAVTAKSIAFLKQLFLIGAILLLVAMTGAWVLSRSVTQPLKSVTVAARKIADGNYSVREPVRTSDELGELTRAFNGMAERIGESHALLGVRVQESEALAQQLHRASTAKSEFLAMMSHELRTPLSAIAGYAEILQMGMRGELNASQRADLARIQSNQVHLLRIINDILDLAQVESGQMQVTTEPVAMGDVLSDLEPIVMPLFAGGNVKYVVQPNVLSLNVLAERDRLTQVLVNLVANAARFTERGSVSIHATQSAGTVQLHITDTGIGIPLEKQEAIFQPFVQADSGASRRAQGTGLGLAISRRLAEAMGGTLTVRSAPEQGSTFTLTLRVPEAQSAPGHRSAASILTNASKDYSSTRESNAHPTYT